MYKIDLPPNAVGKALRFLCTTSILASLLTTAFAADKHVSVQLPEGINYVSSSDLANGYFSMQPVSSDGTVPIIVKIKGTPAALSRGLQSFGLENAEEAHSRVASAIASIESKRQGCTLSSTSLESPIGHEYYTCFNGLSARVSPNSIEEIKKLADVEGVYRDAQVKADLATSVPQINADDVQRMGYTGAGVVVAVVDTGIYYKHPDLGGGFGANYRVIGGWNFVANTADPLDDNGHGTHCAGIIGANGTLKGVAPGVKFLAYKVLDATGGGYTSDIVAGIEKAMDPDGNPATDDAADIISMSLGSMYSTTDDPSAQAVEVASAAGVLCVCAAGNAGIEWSIAAPACAPSALTVGAVDSTDSIASFESKGPAFGSFDIKPDCVAPGVNINSCFLNNGYQLLSGTSMATPHVAGVAALLKSAHPDWTPELLKAAIMEGCKVLPKSIFEQGAGRVDALNSLNPSSIVTPASISLGLCDRSQWLWQQARDITIHNLTGVTQSYQISATTEMPGITISLSQTSAIIPAGGSAIVTATISVDNTKVPQRSVAPYTYLNKINIFNALKSITIPVVFGDCAVMQISYTGRAIVNVMDTATGQSMPPIVSSPQNVYLKPGKYDVVAEYMPNIYIVQEKIDVQNVTPVQIDASMATKTVTLNPVDKDGNILRIRNQGQFIFEHVPSGYSTCTWFYENINSILTNGFSGDYHLLWSIQGRTPTAWYTARNYLDGVSTDSTSNVYPADYKHTYLRYYPADGDGAVYQRQGQGFEFKRPGIVFNAWYVSGPCDPMYSPYITDFYSSADKGGASTSSQDLFFHYSVPNGDPASALSQSSWLKTLDSHTITGISLGTAWPAEVFRNTSDYLSINAGPRFWTGQVYSSGGNLYLAPAGVLGGTMFISMLNDMCHHAPLVFDIAPTVGLPEHVTVNGTGVLFGQYRFPLSTTKYTSPVVVSTSLSNSSVAGRKSITRAKITLDPVAGDLYCPSLSRFQVSCDGAITNTIPADRISEVILNIFDRVPATCQLMYRTVGGNWIPVTGSLSGTTYRAQLPYLPANTFIDLRVVLSDGRNTLDTTMEPALYVCPGAISPLRNTPNNTYIQTSEVPVTACANDGFYIEDPKRTSAIKVLSTEKVIPEEMVSVQGFVTTQDTLKVLQGTNVVHSGRTMKIAPFQLSDLSFGGRQFGMQPGVKYFKQIRSGSTTSRVLKSSTGLSNIGLLVKIVGRVTAVGVDYLYVDDGSGIDDGNASTPGIRVAAKYTGAVGDYVSVTGIASSRNVTTTYGAVRMPFLSPTLRVEKLK